MSVALESKELPSDCFVYKHSTACNLSASAAVEIRAMEFPLPLYWVNVIEQRDVSNWIEEAYGERHESPQLLKIESGKVVSVWNHREVQRDIAL